MKKFLSGTGLLLGAAALVISFGACGVDPEDRPLALDFRGDSASGCGNIYVYKENSTRLEWLVIRAEREKLGLSTTPKTFDLDSAPDGLSVVVDSYARAPQSPKYCNDVIVDHQVPAIWRATSGTITITISEDAPAFNMPYRATVLLKNVRFENGGGKSAVLEEKMLKDVMVGWLPG